MPQDPQAVTGVVDIRAPWQGGAHEQCAERAIRPGVLWRKGSFGTQSAAGSPFDEAIMTMVATLKQQLRNVLDHLTAACEAAYCGQRAPSLLPTPGDLRQGIQPAA